MRHSLEKKNHIYTKLSGTSGRKKHIENNCKRKLNHKEYCRSTEQLRIREFFSSHKHTRPPSYQKQRSVCLSPATTSPATLSSIQIENNDNINNNRLSWPQFRNINQTQHPSNVTSAKGGYIARGREDQPHSNNKFRRDTHTPLERVLPKDEANVMERANQIVMYVKKKTYLLDTQLRI